MPEPGVLSAPRWAPHLSKVGFYPAASHRDGVGSILLDLSDTLPGTMGTASHYLIAVDTTCSHEGVQWTGLCP